MSLATFVSALDHLATHLRFTCPVAGWAEACAQHYGLQTELLDFTTDPDVAVAFGAGGVRRRADQVASVTMLLTNDAAERGMEVVLPPPFAKRLHLQKGLFVRVKSRRRSTALARTCMELRFPLDKGFSVVRQEERLASADLLPANDWLRHAASISRTSGSKVGGAMDCARLACSTFLPNELAPGEDQWLQFIDEMLHWLVIRLSSKQQGWAIDPRLLQQVASRNECALGALIERNDALTGEAEADGRADEARDRGAWNQVLRDSVQGVL
jgi:hypothetical protein